MFEGVFSDFKSERLWVLLIYVALLFTNAMMGVYLNMMILPDDQITEVGYVVVAYILGKSIRDTGAGAIFGTGITAVTQTARELGSKLQHADNPADLIGPDEVVTKTTTITPNKP